MSRFSGDINRGESEGERNIYIERERKIEESDGKEALGKIYIYIGERDRGERDRRETDEKQRL